MMTITARKSASDTKEYYASQERSEDREESPPRWWGMGALRMGLQGLAEMRLFRLLIDNLKPDGSKLTPRIDKDSIRIHDFTFGCPKGVSLAAELGPDGEMIRDAFRESVQEALGEAEKLSATRVRLGGQDQNRMTGELTATLFAHHVNRSLQPHLHMHACIHNHTFDPEERRHKALQAFHIYKEAPAIEQRFHTAMRRRMESMGFRTRDHGKFWDLADVPKSVLRRFSDRRESIEKLYARAEKITPAMRDAAGIITRPKKEQHVDLGELRERWKAMLSPSEKIAFAQLRARPKVNRAPKKGRARVAYLRRLGDELRRRNDRSMER